MRHMIIIVLTFMLSLPVTAQDFQKGMEAYQRNDYAAALREWRPLAEQGYVGAQTNLGLMYDDGKGVPEDHAEAVKWYRLAAEQGDGSAQFNLGSMYNIGRGVPEDHAEALKWFRRAAEQGLANAQFIIGNIYQGMGGTFANRDASDEDKMIAVVFGQHDYAGLGVPRDDIEAAKWYSKAAEQGLSIAQRHICVMYQHGLGVPQDYVEAHMWCSLVERSDNPGLAEIATGDLAMFVEQMTPQQIAKAQRLASEWLEKHGKAE